VGKVATKCIKTVIHEYSHADEFVLLDNEVNAIKKGVGHLTATLFPLLTVQSADVEF
jgi:hypothetical protein